MGKYVTKELPYLEWRNYDPGIYGLNQLPSEQFDFVVSTDVLEHVEPDMLDGTLDQMREYALKGMFHHIACDPCKLILPDGRNAHLIVQEPSWWLEKFLTEGWELMYYADCQQRKRGGLKRHCIIQLDRIGG